jgi:hypothetical protein
VARQLRAAGHLIYVTSELGVRGDDDDVHIERATSLGAAIATQNQQDFAPLHHRRQVEGRPHAGILLLPQSEYIGRKMERLERAARLLTAEAAHNQLMNLGGFDTEEHGLAYVVSLTPAP